MFDRTDAHSTPDHSNDLPHGASYGAKILQERPLSRRSVARKSTRLDSQRLVLHESNLENVVDIMRIDISLARDWCQRTQFMTRHTWAYLVQTALLTTLLVL